MIVEGEEIAECKDLPDPGLMELLEVGIAAGRSWRRTPPRSNREVLAQLANKARLRALVRACACAACCETCLLM